MIGLALNASGVQFAQAEDLSEENTEYDQLAHEILYGDSDAKIAKKKLKFERKMRGENAGFQKNQSEILKQIQSHKRKFEDEQVDLTHLEQELRAKTIKLKKVLDEIHNLKCNSSEEDADKEI